MPRPRPHPRDEQGSIAISMMIMVIATAVTGALLTTVFRDVRVSRRSGDSANALQVADAGVNEAAKAVRTAAGAPGTCSMFPSTWPGFTQTSTIAGGSFTYCAAYDAAVPTVWHIDSKGTDATGVQRRLRAAAVAEPSFPDAIHVMSAASFSAGFSVDSYKDEVSRCTKKGKVGSNDPANLSFGSSGLNTSENCQNRAPFGSTGAWPYPGDGCVAYSRDGTLTFPPSKIGPGQCPSTNTTSESPEFFRATATSTGPVDFPVVTPPGTNFICDGTPSTWLQPGKTYYYLSVILAEGCRINPVGLTYPALDTPVKIFTKNLTIAGGAGSGLDHFINPPPDSPTVCGPTHGTGLPVVESKLYCPGWAGALQIEVMAGGSTPQVQFTGNHSTFWGVIKAPSAVAKWALPSWEVFGSMVIKSVDGATQAKWHYDEALGKLTTGRFFAKQWREEPLQ